MEVSNGNSKHEEEVEINQDPLIHFGIILFPILDHASRVFRNEY